MLIAGPHGRVLSRRHALERSLDIQPVCVGDLCQLTVQRPPIRPTFVWVTGHCSLDDLGDSPLIMKKAPGFEEEDTSARAPGGMRPFLDRCPAHR